MNKSLPYGLKLYEIVDGQKRLVADSDNPTLNGSPASMRCTYCELHLTKSEVERNFKLGRDKYSNLYCEDCEDVPPSLAQITLDVD